MLGYETLYWPLAGLKSLPVQNEIQFSRREGIVTRQSPILGSPLAFAFSPIGTWINPVAAFALSSVFTCASTLALTHALALTSSIDSVAF